MSENAKKTIKARKVSVIENLKSLLLLEKAVAGLKNDGATKADIIAINKKLTAIDSTLAVDDTSLDTMQKIVTYIKGIKNDLVSLAISDVEGLQNALNLKADKSFVKGVESGINTEIVAIKEILKVNDTSLDELQEIVDFIKLNRSDLDNLNISSIAGLETALEGKAQKAHTHSSDDVDYKGKSLTTKLAELEAAVSKVITTSNIEHGSTKLDVKITTIDNAIESAKKSSEGYVKTSIEKTKTDLTKDIDTAKKDAGDYTDAKTSSALSSTKDYTKSAIDAAKISLETKISTAESSTKSDTDKKVSEAETRGNTYINGKVKTINETTHSEVVRVNGELSKADKERNVMMYGSPEDQNIPIYDPKTHVSGDIVLISGEVCILD